MVSKIKSILNFDTVLNLIESERIEQKNKNRIL
jgi:hypothetical protein